MGFSSSVFGGAALRRAPAGLHRHHRRKRVTRHGRGFFGDLWSKIKDVGSQALPHIANIGKDLAIGLIKKKIGLGLRRHRRRTVGKSRRKSHRTHRGGVYSDYVGTGRSHKSHRKSHHGRGILGTLGSLAGMFGLGKKRRTHRGRARSAFSAIRMPSASRMSHSVYGGRHRHRHMGSSIHRHSMFH